MWVCIQKLKNSTPTPAHQDNFYWSRKPANALTAYVALTKQSKKNGVISYLLGSHKHGVLKHKKVILEVLVVLLKIKIF